MTVTDSLITLTSQTFLQLANKIEQSQATAALIASRSQTNNLFAKNQDSDDFAPSISPTR